MQLQREAIPKLEKNGQCLIIASDVSSHLGLQFWVTLIFSTLEVGVTLLPLVRSLERRYRDRKEAWEFLELYFIFSTVLQLYANKFIFLLNSEKSILNCAYCAFLLTKFQGNKNPVSEKPSVSRLCPAPLGLCHSRWPACAPHLSSQSNSFYASSPDHFALVCPILASLLCSSLKGSTSPWQMKTRKTNPRTNPAVREMRTPLKGRGLWTFFNPVLPLSWDSAGTNCDQILQRRSRKLPAM